MAKTKEETAAPVKIEIDADVLSQLGGRINEIDTNIASASGNEGAAKKAFVEQVTQKHAPKLSEMTTNIITQLRELDIELLVGLVTNLKEQLDEDLGPVVDEWVNTEFPKTLSEKVDVPALREQRKALIGQFKALREVLNTFKIPNDHIPDPKRSGGGRPPGSATGEGKSGMNKEGYRYTMDGKDRPPSQNSFSSLAYYATGGVPKALDDTSTVPRWGSKELKEFVASKDIVFGETDTWEIELPNGKKIGARRLTDQDKIELHVDESDDETPAEASGEATTETAPAAT